MPDKGRPRLALDTPPSLLLRPRPDAPHACSLGPILSLQAAAAGSAWTCRTDQLQLRWQMGGGGELESLTIDPPGSNGHPPPGSWMLLLPLEHLVLAADRQGLAEKLVVDEPWHQRGGQRDCLETERLREAMHALHGHGRDGRTGAWLSLEPKIVELLVGVLLACRSDGGGYRRDRGWQHLIQSLRRMRSGLQDDLSLPELSVATGVSPRALQMAFRRHLNKRPLQSLRELRLSRLRQLLLEVDRPGNLLQTVELCGLPSNSTTARHYQERYGEKPSQTRR
ncbi:MAG: helix-turn-helix domain-containing protein [Cyanobacteria bacterium M_surface_10_m2_119]|nr:helix-turn-helix domain-containing protein [Cyanobacteria bacterium M_surface_10_m2_119]